MRSTEPAPQPILVVANARSGSTLLMQLLGLDERCFFTQLPPYEIRYLTYLCKVSALWERQNGQDAELIDSYYHYKANGLATPPWGLRGLATDHLSGFPSSEQLLSILWKSVAASFCKERPQCRFYVEKAPYWITPMVERITRCSTIDLFRDPRDVFVSLREQTKRADPALFGRTEQQDDLQYALFLSRATITQYENHLARRESPGRFLLRYEDLIADHRHALREVESHLGLSLKGSLDASVFEEHRTSNSAADSIRRFEREQLDERIKQIFEHYLSDMMVALGYMSEEARKSDALKVVFDARTIDLLKIKGDGRLRSAGDDRALVELSGENFQVVMPFSSFEADNIREVWLCIAGRAGSRFSLYWRGGGESFSDERSVTMPYYPADHFDVLRFDLSSHPLWRGAITELKLGLFNGPNTANPASPPLVRWVRLIENAAVNAREQAAESH